MEDFLNQFLFWVHVVLVISFPVIGWRVGPFLMLAIIAAHRAHVWLLGECAFSKLQRRLGGLPPGRSFLQQVSLKIFKRDCSSRQCQLADYSIVAMAFVISLARIN